jgi:hypothetical protein
VARVERQAVDVTSGHPTGLFERLLPLIVAALAQGLQRASEKDWVTAVRDDVVCHPGCRCPAFEVSTELAQWLAAQLLVAPAAPCTAVVQVGVLAHVAALA